MRNGRRRTYAPPRLVRQLTAEQQAAIDIEQAIYESRATHTELQNTATALEGRAERARADADNANRRRHHQYPQTTVTTAWGVFAWLAMAANWCLELTMFASMDISWAISALLATVGTAAFAGMGALALDWLRAGPGKQLGGAAVLLLLALAAGYLVPVLAAARADEMYADQIGQAADRVAIHEAMASTGPQDPLEAAQAQLELAQAQHTLTTLPVRRDNARRIFTGLLAMTLFVEVALAGYGFDLLTRRRATRLERQAVRLDEEAALARQDAAAEDDLIQQEFADIAARHRLPLDTIETLTRERIAALQKGVSAPLSPPSEPLPHRRPPADPSRNVVDLRQPAPISESVRPSATTPAPAAAAVDDGMLA